MFFITLHLQRTQSLLYSTLYMFVHCTLSSKSRKAIKMKNVTPTLALARTIGVWPMWRSYVRPIPKYLDILGIIIPTLLIRVYAKVSKSNPSHSYVMCTLLERNPWISNKNSWESCLYSIGSKKWTHFNFE